MFYVERDYVSLRLLTNAGIEFGVVGGRSQRIADNGGDAQRLGVLQKIVHLELYIAQDRPQKAGAKYLARMDWNCRDPSVTVPEQEMAAAAARDFETKLPKNAD